MLQFTLTLLTQLENVYINIFYSVNDRIQVIDN